MGGSCRLSYDIPAVHTDTGGRGNGIASGVHWGACHGSCRMRASVSFFAAFHAPPPLRLSTQGPFCRTC